MNQFMITRIIHYVSFFFTAFVYKKHRVTITDSQVHPIYIEGEILYLVFAKQKSSLQKITYSRYDIAEVRI
jgi:hypothetical protein